MSRVTINVNGLSLVHEDSGGVSTATLPDVCFTPGAGAVPYPNVALSRDLAGGSSLVRADGGHRVAVAGSSCARSAGGEPGAGGGVTSGVSGREATFLTHSFDVTIEGRGACRLTDKMLHNRGNTINCSGHLQPPVAGSAGGRVGAPKAQALGPKTTLPPLDQTRRTAFGLDTNLGSDPQNQKLNTAYALSLPRPRTFVGRYLIAFPQGNSTVPGVSNGAVPPELVPPLPGTSNGSNPGLTLEEAHTLIKGGMQVFAIWEITKYRAIESGTVKGQHELGRKDAMMAKHQIASCGGEGRPIYFTVDFDVVWKRRAIKMVASTDHALVPELVHHSNQPGKAALAGDLIEHYFRGIKSVLDPSLIGVYGTFRTVKKLLDLEYAQWGWQQAFGKKAGKIDHRVRLIQNSIKANQNPDPVKNPFAWGVNGGGALDLDRTAWADFGQWGPPPKKDTTGGST